MPQRLGLWLPVLIAIFPGQAHSDTPRVMATMERVSRGPMIIDSRPGNASYRLSVTHAASSPIQSLDFGTSCIIGSFMDQMIYQIIPSSVRQNSHHLMFRSEHGSAVQFTAEFPKDLLIPPNSTKDITVWALTQSEDLLFDLPICASLQGTDKKLDILVSQEKWAEADANFPVGSAYSECEKSHFPQLPHLKSELKVECKSLKEDYSKIIRALQFSCVLKKRVIHRSTHIQKYKHLAKISALPDKERHQTTYKKRLATLQKFLSSRVMGHQLDMKALEDASLKIKEELQRACSS